ncbi:hypothetical protein GQ457_18G006420 [Hibiscus cannabinus]
MTRANSQSPLRNLDPKIKRTAHKLRQMARRLMTHGQNNGQNPIEGQNAPAPATRQEPPASTMRLLVPPANQNNRQQPIRAVRDYLVEDLDGLNPVVIIPEFQAEHFECKPVMFNTLNILGQFGGTQHENARQHLKSFLKICNLLKIHGVSNDILKMKLFPYSLRDKVKAWLENLTPGSLQTWIHL